MRYIEADERGPVRASRGSLVVAGALNVAIHEMSRFFFACLVDGQMYPDAFGMQLSSLDLPEQARGILMSLVQERLPTETTISITVAVRDGKGCPVYAAHGVMMQHPIVEARG